MDSVKWAFAGAHVQKPASWAVPNVLQRAYIRETGPGDCGIWGPPAPCPNGGVCQNGRCGERVCSAAWSSGRTPVCRKSGLRVYPSRRVPRMDTAPNPVGPVKSAPLVCQAAGETCRDSCREGATSCVDDRRFQVCSRQASGCLDYGSPQLCPDGQRCSEGSRPSDACAGLDSCSKGQSRCWRPSPTVRADPWAAGFGVRFGHLPTGTELRGHSMCRCLQPRVRSGHSKMR